MKDVIFAHMPNLILAFHLMAEYNNPNSFWAPYLQTLPRTYSTVLYLSHQELLQLKGSQLLEEVVKVKRNVARQYAYFSMKLEVSSKPNSRSPFGPLTYELFRYEVYLCYSFGSQMTQILTSVSAGHCPLWWRVRTRCHASRTTRSALWRLFHYGTCVIIDKAIYAPTLIPMSTI